MRATRAYMPGDLQTYLGGGALAATIGGVALWLAQRLVGKAAVQTALNNGFKDLMVDIERDRDYWRQMVLDERKTHAQELNAMRVAHAKEIAMLEGQILNLTQGYESLKSDLRRKGYDVPGAPPQVREMIILESTKDS